MKKGQAGKKERLSTKVLQLANTNFFWSQAAKIYGGFGGLWDYGPLGCSLKSNIINEWKQHFIVEENMLEVSCTNVTPGCVLRASGHVEKFHDYLCVDEKTEESHRADHLLEEWIDKLIESDKEMSEERKKALLNIRGHADAYTMEELQNVMLDLKVLSPEGNKLGPLMEFNLMFKTQLGPTGRGGEAFLRPESAQGIFVNFENLLRESRGQLPFAGAQIGSSFRNEINPRSGLLRVREFTVAEIEHFCEENDSTHPKLKDVANVVLNFLPKENQDGSDKLVSITTGEAMKTGVVKNETLAYFMARTQLFLVKLGIPADKIRFRQHKDTEMAHYSSDCWDAEVLLSYGWIECVGHADRSCYDLEKHSEESKTPLVARVKYDKPKKVKKMVAQPNYKNLKEKHPQDIKNIVEVFKTMPDAKIREIAGKIENSSVVVNVKGIDISFDKTLISFKEKTVKVHGHDYTPFVIEPSFGIDRILYSVMEHCYSTPYEKELKRVVMRFPTAIAPFKFAVLSQRKDNVPLARKIASLLQKERITCELDVSGVSIGRKYARTEERGVPFAVTVDFDSQKEVMAGKDPTVTVRDRDSTKQVRVSIPVLLDMADRLNRCKTDWETIYSDPKTYPHFSV